MPVRLRLRKASEIPHSKRSKLRGEDWPAGACHVRYRVEQEGGPAPTNLSEATLSLSPPFSKLNIGQASQPETYQPVLDEMNEVIPAVHRRIVGFAPRRLDEDLYV